MTLGEIFARSPDWESFRAAVLGLDGSFAFDSGAMIELGTAYFRRFPETSCGRDLDAVHFGYAAVRLCATEHAVRELSPEGKAIFRAAFRETAALEDRWDDLLSDPDRAEALRGDFRGLETALASVKASIDEIPKGPIKERFIGGISLLFNVGFLIRMKLAQRGREES